MDLGDVRRRARRRAAEGDDGEIGGGHGPRASGRGTTAGRPRAVPDHERVVAEAVRSGGVVLVGRRRRSATAAPPGGREVPSLRRGAPPARPGRPEAATLVERRSTLSTESPSSSASVSASSERSDGPPALRARRASGCTPEARLAGTPSSSARAPRSKPYRSPAGGLIAGVAPGGEWPGGSHEPMPAAPCTGRRRRGRRRRWRDVGDHAVLLTAAARAADLRPANRNDGEDPGAAMRGHGRGEVRPR